MRTKKYPPSGRAPAVMSLAAARDYLEPRVEKLLNEWIQNNVRLISKDAGQVTFLNDYGLRRQPDGSVKLFGPNGLRHMPREANFGLDELALREWLRKTTCMKARLLVLDELILLTANRKLDITHLGKLESRCNLFCEQLYIREGTLYIWSAGYEWLDFLDPEILALTRQARDTISSLATYNVIAANLPAWKALEAQAPNLMPLISYVCRKKSIQFDQNVLRSLKQYGKQFGLTEAGWKVLCKLSVGIVRYLTEFPLKDYFRLASHYGEIAIQPDEYLLWWHTLFCEARGLPLGSIPTWFDAAALRENMRLYKGGMARTTTFARNEYMDALDWMQQYLAGGGVPDKNQKRAGWQWIKRQSDAWHEEQARRQAATHAYTWRSALEAYQDDGFDVVPLTSSIDLAVEGARMHHCVGSYDHYCHEGSSRIFSIRKNEERLATVELVRRDKAWKFNQARGPCNATPGPQIMAIASRLQDLYNAATRTSRK